MLILSRKIGEEIHIGDDIVIKLHNIKGGRAASIGIKAPESVQIRRAELPKDYKKSSSRG
jgi:carbon storage regulator